MIKKIFSDSGNCPNTKQQLTKNLSQNKTGKFYVCLLGALDPRDRVYISAPDTYIIIYIMLHGVSSYEICACEDYDVHLVKYVACPVHVGAMF